MSIAVTWLVTLFAIGVYFEIVGEWFDKLVSRNYRDDLRSIGRIVTVDFECRVDATALRCAAEGARRHNRIASDVPFTIATWLTSPRIATDDELAAVQAANLVTFCFLRGDLARASVAT